MLKFKCEAEGTLRGIVHLVFLAALALKVGMSAKRSIPDDIPENVGGLAFFDEEAGTVTIYPIHAPVLFYNDGEGQEVVKELVASIKSMGVGALTSELTRAACEYTLATLEICNKDLRVPVKLAEEQWKAAEELVTEAF
ncbi:hypothetical protein N7G274_009254 [Stereocaulon virgatum]|uniref:Uncharacterized protein n=1 Tax=Stereocaulon virgatum TaxID=373712 RepID=A0ABR3ZXV8_9LECA